jgi:hypothetical protein
VRWDRQAYTLSATCSRATVPDAQNPVQEQIEKSIGIEHRGYVIAAGPLEISLGPDGSGPPYPNRFVDLTDVSAEFLTLWQ